VELNLINEMAIASWRARRASALETALLSTEVEELADLTGLETDSNGVLLSAFGYANAVGRNKAVVELARQAERLNRLWMRLHTKLKELQKDRKAAEKQAVASAGQGAAGKRKNEPEGAEPPSDQRVGDGCGRPAGPVEPPLPPEEPVAGQPLAA
jgi:septal ring factor EnvC (AmiA/AmiB activator)